MELEKSIENLKKYVELVLNKNYCDCNELNIISCGKYGDGSKNVAESIKTVLKALENSIDKEVLKQKRWECIKQAGSYDVDNATIEQHKSIGGFEVLNKLLEEKQ